MKPLEQRGLPSLGGSEVSREGGTPLMEAGVSLTKLGLSLRRSRSAFWCAFRAALTRQGGKMRSQR